MDNNDYDKKIRPLYSWPAIIITIIVFFPLGIYLLYKRAKFDKNSGRSNGKGLIYGAYFCFFMTVIGISETFKSGFKGESIIMILLFFGSGIVLFMSYKKLTANAEKYRKYIAIIINGNEFIIDNIAGAMSLPTNVVRKDLNDMINNGYFKGAYINDSTNEIVLPQQSKSKTNEAKSYDTPQVQPKVIACKSCGAQNKVNTSGAECEYCGSPL